MVSSLVTQFTICHEFQSIGPIRSMGLVDGVIHQPHGLQDVGSVRTNHASACFSVPFPLAS